MSEIPNFFRHAPVPLPLHCFRLRRQTETSSALQFVIGCASNSIIHVQRSQLGTCCQSTTAAAGSKLSLQRPDTIDRWLKFQSFFVTLLFHFHCTAVGVDDEQRHHQHFNSSSSAPVIRSSTSSVHNSEHAATAHRWRRDPDCLCNEMIPPTHN